VSEIRAWDATGGNDAPEPGFRMAVADSRDRLTADDPRFVVDKPYSRLVVDWARKG
jgi:protein-L-isoaspartate(D-aspartate) O-methyltransferase